MASGQLDMLEREFVQMKKADGGNVGKVKQHVDSLLDAWKKTKINIAITGTAGAGKSSFINAIRGLTGDDPGAAKVGVNQTTTVLTPYDHPLNKQLKFWDLPGVGTPEFPQAGYLRKVGFGNYDFFIIATSTRFTENDAWLAREVKSREKSCFLVRTKIDEDIENETQNQAQVNRNVDARAVEASVIERVKQNSVEKIQHSFGSDVNVYLISNFDTNKWDFEKLVDDLLNGLPKQKHDAFVLSLSVISKKVIKRKRVILQRYAWLAATASAGVAAAPVPGLSIAVDTGILLSYLAIYRDQFGLDEKTLAETAKQCFQSVDQFKSIAKTASKIAIDLIVTLVKKYAVSEVAEEAARYIPVVGTVVSSVISFATTYAMINDILNELEKEAIAVVEYSIECRARYSSVDEH